MRNWSKQQIEKGARDAMGAKIAQQKKFSKAEPTTSEEMREFYALAIKNNNAPKAGTGHCRFANADELREAIIGYWEYLDVLAQEGKRIVPDLEGLCMFLGISRNTLFTWENTDKNGMRDVISQVKNDIAACKKQLALHGDIVPLFAITDFNNNHGYTQKQEVVVQPVSPLGERTQTAQIMERYIGLIEDKPDIIEG